jgi:hypothetical protein
MPADLSGGEEGELNEAANRAPSEEEDSRCIEEFRCRRAATAEARITDAKGRPLAHATTTCLVFEIAKGT